MSSDLFSDSETFFGNNDSQFRSLNMEDFIVLVQEVVRNKNINDGTALCFQVFYKEIANSIRTKTLNEDYTQLNIISKCIKLLKAADKFDTFAFVDLLLNEFIIIPLEVVWWLHKNEIVYLLQYCDMQQPANLATDLLKIMKENKQNKTFPVSEIMVDLLQELIRGCYRPNVGICRLYRSTTWSEYCFQVLNDLAEETLRTAIKRNNEPFLNFFPYVQNTKKYLPSIILERFYANILNKILLYNTDQFDLHGSYMYQQLWCSEKIDNNILILYEEIFSKYCNMQNILEIMEEHEETNWKLTLAAVGVCVKKSSTGAVDVKSAAMKFLNDSFKGGKIKPFIKAILFIRQGCMEANMKINYRSWYSNTFGSNSDFKTTKNLTLFKFFISTLTKLIPYESKTYLKIQIDQSISAPPKSISLIHDYKNLCRARLEELRQSPCVLMNGVEVSVLHMVEECFRAEQINPMLVNIIITERDSFYNIVVPQILRNKQPFIKVKELLLQEKYLTNEVIHFSRADADNTVFDIEDDDFINKK